jgi:hypothetical protein
MAGIFSEGMVSMCMMCAMCGVMCSRMCKNEQARSLPPIELC